MSIIEFIIGLLILVLCEERKERCECGDWRCE